MGLCLFFCVKYQHLVLPVLEQWYKAECRDKTDVRLTRCSKLKISDIQRVYLEQFSAAISLQTNSCLPSTADTNLRTDADSISSN